VHVVLADGSVHRLNDSIPLNIYQRQLTRSGGEAVQLP
jgi:hypothetical protein